jgi:galactokinase
MTKEEALRRFNAKMPKVPVSVDVATYTRVAVQAMAEVMAEAIELKTEDRSLEEKTGISKEEWDQWWNLSEKIFK